MTEMEQARTAAWRLRILQHAARMGRVLRAWACRYAAASVELGSNSANPLGWKEKTGPQGPHFESLAAERVLPWGWPESATAILPVNVAYPKG